MFYGNTMFIGNTQQPERIELFIFSGYRCRDSVSSISSIKNSPANAVKISAVILNLASDKPDSDKNRKRY